MTLTIPHDPRVLADLIADLWGGEKGAANLHGVDPNVVAVEVLPAGSLRALWPHHHPTDAERAAWGRALEELASQLEDRGYAVERQGDARRVVGWAAAQAYPVPGRPAGCSSLVRIRDLEPSDPRRKAHDDALLDARLARREGPAPDAQLEGARERHAAAYGRGRRPAAKDERCTACHAPGPTVEDTGLCGPCCFGEAATAGDDW